MCTEISIQIFLNKVAGVHNIGLFLHNMSVRSLEDAFIVRVQIGDLQVATTPIVTLQLI